MMRGALRCSFCRRRDGEVAKLVAGPRRILSGRIYICDRCAAQTIAIMNAHGGGEPPREHRDSLLRRILTRVGWMRGDTPRRASECHATL
jgi:ClpX C4-type zinc finger protein